MASIEKHEGKNGITYRITVYAGFDNQGKRVRHRTTWKPKPGMTARQMEKTAKQAALEFEQSLEQGYVADNRQTFAEYAEYVIALKERTRAKHRTVAGYRQLLVWCNQAIGHMLLQDIRPPSSEPVLQ